MKALFLGLSLLWTSVTFAEEFENLAVARVSYLGEHSDPRCHVVGGCVYHHYEVNAVKILCGNDIQVGTSIKTKFPMGSWGPQNRCVPPSIATYCTNELVFAHDEYAVLRTYEYGRVGPGDLSDLMTYTCK